MLCQIIYTKTLLASVREQMLYRSVVGLFRLTRSKTLILLIVCLFVTSTFIFSVSSSSGTIRINGKSPSASGQKVQAGATINLYFGEVTWGGIEFYLLMSQDNNLQVSIPDVIFTPRFLISDLTNPSNTKTYTDGNGFWTVGSNWVNGTIPQGQPVGNYTIKAFDEVTGTVAVTDVFIAVYSVIYSSNLQISPASGPGGISTVFTGSGFPPSAVVTISYFDPNFGSWNLLTTTTANTNGAISFPSQMPDLKKSLGMGDLSEAFTRVQYRAEINGVVYCYVDYNQYSRGLKRVGSQTANGLFGNGTNLASSVNLATGDSFSISGKYFHPGDAIYVRFDGQAVVGTVTGDQWRNAQIIGTSIADATGYFFATATLPTANAGEHYLSIEDSQTKVIAKIYVSMATLSLSPGSGPGGASVQFSGSRYPASIPITISYLDPKFGSWNTLSTTTSDTAGNIQFSAVMPDLRTALTGYDTYESSKALSFRTESGGAIYCYADYNEYSRGLKTVGPQTAVSGLYGNGTNFVSSVKVLPGDSMTVSGKWFHVQDVVYIRWDGWGVVGTVTGDQWRNAQIIGSSIADATGYFQAIVTIPLAEAGEHYLAVEDSQAKVIVKVAIAPSNQTLPTNRSQSSVDLSCKSTTTYIGYNVEISGKLTSNSAGIPNSQILLSYSNNGGTSWTDLTSVYTDSSGGFLAVWMPSVSGDHLIRAKFNGNQYYNASSKTIAFVSTPYSNQNVFSVASNSTVSGLAFNSAANELSFVVTGDNGTRGFVDVSIAKNLIPDISKLKVYLDGVEQQYTTTNSSDAWLIHFIYDHSTHNVVIDMAANASPTESIAPTSSSSPSPTNDQTETPTSSQPTPTNTPSSSQSTANPGLLEKLSTPLILAVSTATVVVVIVVLVFVRNRRGRQSR